MPAYKDFVEGNPSADLSDGTAKFAMLNPDGSNAEATVTALAAAPAFAAQYAPSVTDLVGLLAARPAAAVGNAGWSYTATDVDGGTLYRSNGSSWVQVAGPVTPASTSPIQFARKTSDQTVNNSTTAIDDSALSLAALANSVYTVDAFVIYDSSTTADIKIRVRGSGDWTGYFSTYGLDTAATTAVGSLNLTATAVQSFRACGGIGVGSLVVARVVGVVNTVTAANLAISWAQNTLDATNTTVRSGSWLRIEKVA